MQVMKLQIRTITDHSHSIRWTSYPRELEYDEEQHTDRLPMLHGELGVAAPRSLRLVLRVHNQAGIPIIEGQNRVEAGQRSFTIGELRPLGIEAYAHKREAERLQIARRIWSRRAYGTLTFLATP